MPSGFAGQQGRSVCQLLALVVGTVIHAVMSISMGLIYGILGRRRHRLSI